MNIFYWSPFLSEVATVKAVLESASGVSEYSKENKSYIINSVGEWNDYEKDILSKNIGLIKLLKNKKFYKYLPRYGFLKSRISYFLIILSSIYKLHLFFKKLNENDVVILHLLVSLPMILNILFNYKCKFILRISGYPKLTLVRYFIWYFAGKKIFKITSPTIGTYKEIIKKKIFDKKKVFILRDPIINIKKINYLSRIDNDKFLDSINFNYCLSIGRLTKQKNFSFLLKNFKDIEKIDPKLHLIILGDGEEKKKLISLIKKLNLNDKVHLVGFKKNVFKYLSKADCFILSSLWEDPGFVLLEAAFSKIPIISSNCKNGPMEILEIGKSGYLFETNNDKSFIEAFQTYSYDKKYNQKKMSEMVKSALMQCKNFSKYKHYNELMKLI